MPQPSGRHVIPGHRLAAPGVWWAPWLSDDGHPMLAAVAPDGRLVEWEIVYPHMDPAATVAKLKRVLLLQAVA